MTDLFGGSNTRFSGNVDAYRGLPGSGPVGKTCGDCRHAHKHLRYWKCGLVKMTHSEATDIRLKTPACKFFEEKADMKFLEHCTDEELVRELVKRAKDRDRLQPAPTMSTRHTPHSSVLIGIGTDHTADLVLDDDAVSILLHGREMAS